MQELFTAIHNRFSAEPHNDFYKALNGHLSVDQADQEWVMPYGVYTLVSNVPEYTFDGPIENARIQFSIFSKNKSSIEVVGIYNYLKMLYDSCQLDIAGHHHLMMQRIGNRMIKHENYWQYVVDYRVMYE